METVRMWNENDGLTDQIGDVSSRRLRPALGREWEGSLVPSGTLVRASLSVAAIPNRARGSSASRYFEPCESSRR